MLALLSFVSRSHSIVGLLLRYRLLNSVFSLSTGAAAAAAAVFFLCSDRMTSGMCT